MTRVLVLGSTGSIGTQTLEVIAANADRFEVVGLAAGGSRRDLLQQQQAALGLPDRAIAVGADHPDAIVDLIASTPADIVLNAIDGLRGLRPTMAALATGARLALANKESLVAAGSLVLDAAAPDQIVPVDSEHSAIAQCLRGEQTADIAKLVVTASGGPFCGRTRDELWDVTPEEAGKHPTWNMGSNITLNSATLVNKALEVIEAHVLFGIDYDNIDVTVHRQSIVHSMVTFTDGSTIAQASPPTMKIPIALALGWPERLDEVAPPCDFSAAGTWTFEPVDSVTFPAIELARAAGRRGTTYTAIFNAANEQAAAAFLAGRLRFPDIVDVVTDVLAGADGCDANPGTVDDVIATEAWARTRADELIAAHQAHT